MFRKIWDKITGRGKGPGGPALKPDQPGATKAEREVFQEIDKLKGNRKQLFKLLRDPKVRNQVAGFYQRLKEDGIDPRNEEAVKKWAVAHKDELDKTPAASADAPKPATVLREGPKIGRNDPCHCGNGKKFKKCHGSPN